MNTNLTMEDRPAKVIIIIGAPNCGKTTIIEKFIKKEKEKTLIVVPDDKDWKNIYPIEDINTERFHYRGIKKRIWGGNADLVNIFQRFDNGLLIFEDCKPLLKSRLAEPLELILGRKRQGRMDIIVSAHGFSKVAPTFFTYATEYVLFQTLDSIACRRDVISEYEEVKAMVNFVNKNAKTDSHFCRSFKRI